MAASIKRVTVNLPAKLLAEAEQVSGRGITETIVLGLEQLARRSVEERCASRSRSRLLGPRDWLFRVVLQLGSDGFGPAANIRPRPSNSNSLPGVPPAEPVIRGFSRCGPNRRPVVSRCISTSPRAAHGASIIVEFLVVILLTR